MRYTLRSDLLCDYCMFKRLPTQHFYHSGVLQERNVTDGQELIKDSCQHPSNVVRPSAVKHGPMPCDLRRDKSSMRADLKRRAICCL